MTSPPPPNDRPLPELPRGFSLKPLSDALLRANYTLEALIETLDLNRNNVIDMEVAMMRTSVPGPHNTMVRLFTLGQPVSLIDAAMAFGSVDFGPLIDIGLLAVGPEGVSSQISISTHGGLFVAHDFSPSLLGEAIHADIVPTPTLSTTTVATLTVRKPVGQALDVGGGQGFLALLAARHAGRVVCTDVNPRALRFAAIGAALNGFSHVEVRQGSLFEPVAGERFDLITANLPFVISPDRDYVYRDGGFEGDGLCERFIREVPAMLNEGGTCTLTANWHGDDDDWAARPRAWLAGSGCDAFLFLWYQSDPLRYSAVWIKGNELDRDTYRRKLNAWVEYFQRAGIRRLYTGVIVIRRRSGAENWLVAENNSLGVDLSPENASDQVERLFAARDLVQSLGADRARLLDTPMRLTRDHRMSTSSRVENGQWLADSRHLFQTRGYPFQGSISPMIADLVARCDGVLTPRQLLTEVSGRVGATPEQLFEVHLETFERLLLTGFLEAPARGDKPAQ